MNKACRWRLVNGLLLCWGLLLPAAFAGVQKEQQPKLLLEQATKKELIDGDLKGAIEIYNALLNLQSVPREVTAKALLHLGQCYEKLGSAEARKAYERIVREFADQSEPAEQARARLAALVAGPPAKEKAGPILTELKLPAIMELHALSPDGAKVAYIAWSHGSERQGNLIVRDLVSGTDRQITNLKQGMPNAPVWSPDGKSIAYSHLSQDGKNMASWHEEIRIVAIDSGTDRGMGISGQPEDWSRDGRYILYMQSEGPRATLNLLPIAGGQPKTLFSAARNELVERSAANARFSPDGKFVSFSRRNKQAFDIYLLPVDGGEPIPITDHPANDRNPTWAPDGKTLLFLSNRSLGREDLWALPIADGKPSGEPFVVKSDIGRTQLYSLSKNSRLLFATGSGMSHIYSVAIDPKTQQPAAPAVRLTKDPAADDNRWPAWSPDGKRVAYISSFGPPQERSLLHVMSADGSDDREITNVHQYYRGPFAWSLDNDRVYVSGKHPETGAGIYSISTSTGEKRPVLLDDRVGGHLSFSPDGTQLAFVRMVKRAQVHLADTDGKNVRQITLDDSMGAFYPTWSPNGKQIAFFRTGGTRNGLMLLTLQEGAITEVIGGSRDTSEHYIFWTPSWSPDGNHIVWAAPGPTSKPWGLPGAAPAPVLWLAKLTEGKPEQFRVDLESSGTVSFFSPGWSPDGTKMLFSAESNVYQLLLMENFLPPPKTASQ